ncbi:MAG TPA: hypothetical protein VFQ91_29235 [Bryobacteraceae bacterium]|nr:hypothetical protein [Bryobacteraceae bacterium]
MKLPLIIVPMPGERDGDIPVAYFPIQRYTTVRQARTTLNARKQHERSVDKRAGNNQAVKARSALLKQIELLC